ncbi:unnamed protein product [Prunus armeniaca]
MVRWPTGYLEGGRYVETDGISRCRFPITGQKHPPFPPHLLGGWHGTDKMAALGSLQAISLNPTPVVDILRLGDMIEMGELFVRRCSLANHVEGRDHSHQRHPEVGVELDGSIADLCQDPLNNRLQRKPHPLQKYVREEDDFTLLRLT